MYAIENFKDYFAVLEIPLSAGPIEIRRAYKRKAIETHPDKAASTAYQSDVDFKEVQEAYEVLSDSLKRREYITYYREFQHFHQKIKQRKEIEKLRRYHKLVFYCSDSKDNASDAINQDLLNSFEKHYLEIRNDWCISSDLKPIVVNDNNSHQNLRKTIEEMYQIRHQKRNISGFEFHGEIITPEIKHLADGLAECLVTIQLLLHDIPQHEDNFLIGYAIYIMKPKLEIWLEDTWVEYTRLLLQIRQTFSSEFTEWPLEVLYPNSRIKVCATALNLAQIGKTVAEIYEETQYFIPLDQLHTMLRLLNK